MTAARDRRRRPPSPNWRSAHGIAQGRPAFSCPADSQRVAASEQLEKFAAVSVSARARSVAARAGSAFWRIRNYASMIDTPGLSVRDIGEAGPLAQFLASRTGIQRHLVLPARAERGCRQGLCRPTKSSAHRICFFARIDETNSVRAGPERGDGTGTSPFVLQHRARRA